MRDAPPAKKSVSLLAPGWLQYWPMLSSLCLVSCLLTTAAAAAHSAWLGLPSWQEKRPRLNQDLLPPLYLLHQSLHDRNHHLQHTANLSLQSGRSFQSLSSRILLSRARLPRLRAMTCSSRVPSRDSLQAPSCRGLS